MTRQSRKVPKYRAFRVSFLTIFNFIFWGVKASLPLYLYKESVIQKLSKKSYIIGEKWMCTKPKFFIQLKRQCFVLLLYMDISPSKIKAVNAIFKNFSPLQQKNNTNSYFEIINLPNTNQLTICPKTNII